MNKLTGKEIIEALVKILTNEDEISYYATGYIPYGYKLIDIPKTVEEKLGPYEEVEQYGGEGQGDTWFTVKYFKNHDVYIKTDGFYSSTSGLSFYQGVGKEVKPQEKTITVYE